MVLGGRLRGEDGGRIRCGLGLGLGGARCPRGFFSVYPVPVREGPEGRGVAPRDGPAGKFLEKSQSVGVLGVDPCPVGRRSAS